MKTLLTILSILLGISTASIAADITTLTLTEKDGVTTINYPLTFGHVFKIGDVADYVTASYNGSAVTTQCDVKTTYDDGSVRFAVISIIIPSVAANSTKNIVLSTSATTASSGYMDKTTIIATDIEDEIRLTNLSGSGYSGSLTADLNAQITAVSSPSYWLQGSVATEIMVRAGLNNSLEASWEVRFYPGTSFGPRISHSIENMNANYRGIVNYDVDIQAGMPTLSSRYSKSAVVHNENSRWRKVLWIGSEPPETELHYDREYLTSTGSILKYRTYSSVSEQTITSAYSSWSSSNTDIMGSGTLQKYFPTTGGREDIGVLPTWAARYLNSFDNRLKEIVIGNGEMAAHCPIHYREYDESKSFYRLPVSIDDRDTVWTSEDKASTWGDVLDRLPAAIGNVGSAYHGWTIDRAHQGSFAYIPYLITGDRYFLEEMYYWAAYNLSACDYNDSYGRKRSDGIIQDQVRGVAWALRNIADAAALSSDSDLLLKSYLTTKVNNNISFTYLVRRGRYPLGYFGIDIYATLGQMASDVLYVGNPWQEDYVLLSLAHQYQLGFNWGENISWYKNFNNNRFVADGVNPYDGSAYRFPAQLQNYVCGTPPCYPTTWNQYTSMYTPPSSPWTAPTAATHDYRLIALAAASVVSNQSSSLIFNMLNDSGFDWGLFNDDPTWAIMATEQAKHSLGTFIFGNIQ